MLTNEMEQAHDISEPYLNQLLYEWELRHLEEVRAARPPALEPIHHEDPGSVNARARYKLNKSCLSEIEGGQVTRDIGFTSGAIDNEKQVPQTVLDLR